MSAGMRIQGVGNLDYYYTKARFEICLLLSLDAPIFGLLRKKVSITSSWKAGEAEPHYIWSLEGSDCDTLPDWAPDWLRNIITQLTYTQEDVRSTVVDSGTYFRFYVGELRNYERFLEAMARKMSRWAHGEKCSPATLHHLSKAAY